MTTVAAAQGFTRDADGYENLHMVVEGIHCPSCIRKIEGSLTQLAGVVSARVNLSTRRLAVSWEKGALEPEDVVARVEALGFRAVPFNPDLMRDQEAAEDKRLLRAIGVAGFAAANIMLLSVSVWSGNVSDMGEATRTLMHWISALIALPAIAYAGQPFFRSAARAIAARSLNMDVPISLAVLLAAGMSVFQTMQGGRHAYFDAAVMLLFFLLIGRYLDRRMRTRARSAVQNLLALRSRAAMVIWEDGRQRPLPLEALSPGMRVAVAAGERIPVDGIVTSGTGEVDTSLVTGESVPRTTRPGDLVYAGTLNLSGALELEVKAADEDTLLAEIVRLMEAAEQGRARYVRLADRAARVYAPAVHGLAGASFLGWLMLGGVGWEAALMTAITVLIITCPCALGLAVPAVQVVASGRLLEHGVLLKSGDGLERLAAINHVVFDKTGTLTVGAPELANRSEIDDDDLREAATIAAASRHPLARALVEAAGTVPVANHVHEEPGRGLSLGDVRLGSRAWCGVDEDKNDGNASELWFKRPGKPPVCFRFQDRLKTDAAPAIAALKRMGLAVELLSGDREGPVEAVARALGIDQSQAGKTPDQKIARLEKLAVQGRRVLMVGDGLNDAPALAAAFASMSPATGADISQTAADFVIQGNSLMPVVFTLDIARATRRLILQNFGLALIYNLIAVPIAVAGLVTPLIAAIAMSASSVVVIANAMRLKAPNAVARKATP
ncbi:MAG: cadmium-translocating P-type ATPase [Alphaproteobacteria bacterium]|nr:MAG: cadmium-translocating P-type ATPase [Alphaproteobacteria bacterium]